MWFSHLLQENDDATVKKTMTQLSRVCLIMTRILKCYKKSNLEEIHIKLYNQWNQLCCGKAIFV